MVGGMLGKSDKPPIIMIIINHQSSILSSQLHINHFVYLSFFPSRSNHGTQLKDDTHAHIAKVTLFTRSRHQGHTLPQACCSQQCTPHSTLASHKPFLTGSLNLARTAVKTLQSSREASVGPTCYCLLAPPATACWPYLPLPVGLTCYCLLAPPATAFGPSCYCLVALPATACWAHLPCCARMQAEARVSHWRLHAHVPQLPGRLGGNNHLWQKINIPRPGPPNAQ